MSQKIGSFIKPEADTVAEKARRWEESSMAQRSVEIDTTDGTCPAALEHPRR